MNEEKTKIRMIMIPGHTSWSPGASAPSPQFKAGYVEYIQACKLIDSVEDLINALGLKWKVERVDGSHVQPFRQSQQWKRDRVFELLSKPEGGMTDVVIEVHFGSSSFQVKPKVMSSDRLGEDGEPKLPVSRTGSGIRTISKKNCEESKLFAGEIHYHMISSIPLPDRGIGNGDNEVLDGCGVTPAVQIRPLFIDSPIDAHYLRFPRARMFIATALIEGARQYVLKKAEAEKEPRKK